MNFLKLVFSLGIPLMANALPIAPGSLDPTECHQAPEGVWHCPEPNDIK